MRRLRFDVLLAIGIFAYLLSPVLSYEPEYSAHHYPAHTPHGAGHGHGQGWGAQTAGSYYHYHVPLVGQQPSYHPQPHSDHNHLIWLIALIPIALLAALPLLLLKLLPLFLLPTGLALLALLLPPLLMMGMMMMMGMAAMPMMMMMMMMMMMGGGMMMMPPMKRDMSSIFGTEAINQHMQTLGELLFGDVSQLVSRYSRSLDLDKCPERISCEIGSALFPANASRTSTARSFMTYVLDNAVPSGKAKDVLTSCGEALFEGSKSSSCGNFHCQPTFRLYQDPKASASPDSYSKEYYTNPHGTPKQVTASSSSSSSTVSFTPKPSSLKRKALKSKFKATTASTLVEDYYNQYQQQYSAPATQSQNSTTTVPANTKSDRVLTADAGFPYSYYDALPSGQDHTSTNELRANKGVYSRFGTKVVRI